MASARSKTTTDHGEIKRWAESRGGTPAAVKGTGKGTDPGILRIDFPGFSGERSLRPISWGSFFKWFDANGLALVYRDRDRFNKLVSRGAASGRGRNDRRTRRRGEAGSSTQKRAAASRKRVSARRAQTQAATRARGPKQLAEARRATGKRGAQARASRGGRSPAATTARRSTRSRAGSGGGRSTRRRGKD